MSVVIHAPQNFDRINPPTIVATGKATNNKNLLAFLTNTTAFESYTPDQIIPLKNSNWVMFFNKVSAGFCLLNVLDPTGKPIDIASPVLFTVGRRRPVFGGGPIILSHQDNDVLPARDFAAGGNSPNHPIDEVPANGGAKLLYMDEQGSNQEILAYSITYDSGTKNWTASFDIPPSAPCPGDYKMVITDTNSPADFDEVEHLSLDPSLCQRKDKKDKKDKKPKR